MIFIITCITLAIIHYDSLVAQYHQVCLFLCFRPMTAHTVVFYVTVGVHEFQQKLNVVCHTQKVYTCASRLLEMTYTQLHLHSSHVLF